MTELLTAAQMRAIEQAAIAAGDVTGLELMERAGQGVVTAVLEKWPELARGIHRAVVLCGPGNNGGDGFVVARLLAAAGWKVAVYLYGQASKLPPDARTNYERWSNIGPVVALDADFDLAAVFDYGAALCVDALFGTGLNRPVDVGDAGLMNAMHYAQAWILGHGPKTVAVDMPSGVCSDSGRVLGAAVKAAMTVTFHAAKRGHFLMTDAHATAAGALLCKTVVVVDIGLPKASKGPIKLTADVRAQLPADAQMTVFSLEGVDTHAVKKHTWLGHKFDHGHALVLSGGPGRTGAARLAARGALRIGAGLVTLGVPPSAQMEVAAQITALMLARVRDADGLNAVLEDARINALCVGPGLGLGDHAAALVDAVLDAGHLRLSRRVVFDADALTLIAAEPKRMAALNEHAVLTPHGGEFARLFPDIAEKLALIPNEGPAYSKVDATRAAAARCGAIVLFKGADTVIAHPDGRASIHAAAYGREAPWLATAGAGDVLAGFITGLLARGFDPMVACETAGWLHVECARSFGPGLIAEDLPEVLPTVLGNLNA